MEIASYVATLPSEHWTRKILQRTTETRRPAYAWETALQRYCIWKGVANWIEEVAAHDHWVQSKQDFVFSGCTLNDRVKSCISFACALKGVASGRQALTLTSTLVAPFSRKKSVLQPTCRQCQFHTGGPR